MQNIDITHWSIWSKRMEITPKTSVNIRHGERSAAIQFLPPSHKKNGKAFEGLARDKKVVKKLG